MTNCAMVDDYLGAVEYLLTVGIPAAFEQHLKRCLSLS